MADAVQEFLQSGGKGRPAPQPVSVPSGSEDPVYKFLAAGGKPAPAKATPVSAPNSDLQDLIFRDEMSPEAATKAGKFIAGSPEMILSGLTGSAGTLADVFTNSPIGAHDWTYRPRSGPGKFTAEEAGKVLTPVSAGVSAVWDSMFGKGERSQSIKKELVDDLNIAGSAAGAAGILRAGLVAGAKPKASTIAAAAEAPAASSIAEAPLTVTSTARKPFWEPVAESAAADNVVDSEPIAGGLPKEFSRERAEILNRVGLEKARSSALTGDAQRAATDWQMKKFDEPAGKAAFEQFEAEKQALSNFSSRILGETKGSRGLDEDALSLRGSAIAKPFDDLRAWFQQQRSQLYAKADERSGGNPVVKPSSLEETLSDRSFSNQMTARGQTHLIDGIKWELERFRENNGGDALTVKEAEQFRQFLNNVWTPENSATIGKLKGALDNDVLKGAGEDIYGPARKLAQSEKQTLDNPNGITKLFDVDPQNPINRSTALEKIPDTLNRLSADQFSNVIKTLKAMPEDLQGPANQAISEIKGHIINKIMEAGTKTQGQWNAPGVSEYLRKNSAKIRIAFEDQPQVLSMLQDLDSAGKILKVDQSYPGAAAQAANAMKRGFMSQVISKTAAGTGAWIGSPLGPVGAAAGAVGGDVLGNRLGGAWTEKGALKNWEKNSVSLKDLLLRDKK